MRPLHIQNPPDPFDIPEEELCGLPKRLYLHLFAGRVSQGGKIYGVHHGSALADDWDNLQVGDFCILPETKITYPNGFYEATVAHWNGQGWQPRQGHHPEHPLRNSFFPDKWSRKDVMEAVAASREQVIVEDWLPPVSPRKKSNAYKTFLPDGQALIFYIGTPRRNRPKKVDAYTASVFPATR